VKGKNIMKPTFLKQVSESAYDGKTTKYKAMIQLGDQTIASDRFQETKEQALLDLEREIEARLYGTSTDMFRLDGFLVQVKCTKTYDSFVGSIKHYFRYYVLQDSKEYGPEWSYLSITNIKGDLLVKRIDVRATETELREILSAAIESGKIQVPG
jgi:hypothetical protein